jgi:phage terminase large subunit
MEPHETTMTRLALLAALALACAAPTPATAAPDETIVEETSDPPTVAASRKAAAQQLLARWQNDPVLFAREVLGLETWDRQAEMMRAVAEHPRVAVRSGHKIGKSTSAAGLAFWWVHTRPRATVVMTSASYRQVKGILWKELRRLDREARVPLGGKLAEDPETGLQLADGREVVGLSTKEPERIAGYSGANLLFILDEASGIPEPIFEAIEGNRAGGARLVMFSNATKMSGTFYEAFHGKKEYWRTLHISSEETPNATGRGKPIPGLATAEWIAEKRKEWGEESALYQVRVRGNFPTQGDKAVIALVFVTDAVERWTEDEPGEGRLNLGVDVARFGDDESVVMPRRGQRVDPARVFTQLDGPNLAGKVLEVVRELRRTGERPLVKVDVIGVGASCFDVLSRSDEVEAVAVNVSEKATAEGYHALRDQLWGAMRDFLKNGGAIPDDARLQAELVAPEYAFDAQGRMVVESKEKMKKRLGRSPDRADALALAIHEPAQNTFFLV